MLSLKDFTAKAENLISSDDIGKFVGEYDAVRYTTKDENTYNNDVYRFIFTDRLWYDASYDDGKFADWDFMYVFKTDVFHSNYLLILN